MKYTIVVAATASEAAPLQYIAPFTGMSFLAPSFKSLLCSFSPPHHIYASSLCINHTTHLPDIWTLFLMNGLRVIYLGGLPRHEKFFSCRTGDTMSFL